MRQNGLNLFESEIFIPEYRPIRIGRWELRQSNNVLCQGYWGPASLVPRVSALMRDNDIWMSITPLEIESQSIGINLAFGHVAIFGLGMGWAAAAVALSERVDAVTVVEQDPDVIALHADLDIFSQLPPSARSKLRIVQGDALSWTSSEPVDFLMPDIWLPLISDGRIGEVGRMQANVQAKAIYFWGQELEIARHAVFAGRSIDDVGIAATISDFELPLVGMETPDYAARSAVAADRWMGGRWLASDWSV